MGSVGVHADSRRRCMVALSVMRFGITGKPMAWVQFQDSGAATDAMQRLNGQLGMKLEYSRNPLGKRNRE